MPANVGQPTVGDRIQQGLEAICKALQLDPRVAPFAIGFDAVLGLIPKQGEENLRRFVSELVEDVGNLQERVLGIQMHIDRMENFGYRTMVVNVLRAVQFETQDDKRRAYRAILINPLIGELPRYPQATQEWLLNLLNGLSPYALLVLRILKDPVRARQEFKARQKDPVVSVTLWETIFLFSGDQAEQPLFDSIFMDLDGKGLIHLETISRSPRSVTGTDLQNASRMLTDFGREFIEFVSLP